MIPLRVPAVAALCTLPGLATPAGTAASQPEVAVRELSNGLRVVVVAVPGSGAVACRVVYRNGRACDPPGIPGFAELMTLLLDQGTTQVGVRDEEQEKESRRSIENFEVTYRSFYQEALEAFRRGEGADPSAASRPESLQKLRDVVYALEERHRRDWIPGAQRSLYARAGASGIAWRVETDATIFETTIPASRIELFFAVEADRMQNAVLRDALGCRDALRRARMQQAEQTPAFESLEEFYIKFWAGEPWARRGAGAEALDAVPLELIDREKLRFASPSQTSLILAGDVTIEQAGALAQQYFTFPSWVPARGDTHAPTMAPSHGFRMVASGTGPTFVTFAWRVPGAAHRDVPALFVLRELAADILQKRLRNAHNPPLAGASGRASLDLYKHAGMFRLSVETAGTPAPAPLETELASCLEMIRNVQAAEFSAARTRALMRFEQNQVGLESLADALASAESTASLQDWATLGDRIAHLTIRDVAEVAGRTLQPDRCGILVHQRSHSAPWPRAVTAPPASTPATRPASQPAIPSEGSQGADSRAAQSRPAPPAPDKNKK
jgi:predicted Zn-dependent peptidase